MNECRVSLPARLIAALVVLLTLHLGAGVARAQQSTEAECTDRIDNDNDTVLDCADADCFANAACKPDGNPEGTEARCSDWIDNDQDGYLDCDDSECWTPSIRTCQGSWRDPMAAQSTLQSTADDEIPELGAGMTVEDLIGTGGDIDGERNDVVCSDGVDNDDDGRIDCADFGCRFDRTVTVCQGSPDVRFSIVARAEQIVDLEEETMDSRFTRLQLRAFGPMPFLPDSFYLLSMRAERTPRLTFAMFQVPIGKKGNYLNINSGTGGLSVELARSAHKRLLLESPFYVYNAFEQGNGIAIEVGGILARGKLVYRTFVAGGSGRFTGNVGGRFLADDLTNYTYAIGGQMQVNLIGNYNRWDSPMLYTPVPTTLAVTIGAKYDQRAQERYPAANVSAVFRHRSLIILAENYSKRELEFKSWQTAYNIQVGFLVLPKRLLVAADFGEYLSTALEDVPGDEDLVPRQETQWRVAAHYYLWRNVFTGSVLYSDRRQDPAPGETEEEVTREFRVVGQYRF